MSKKSNDHNTVEGTKESFANALAKIEIPNHLKLRDCDLPFWLAIVGARTSDSWNNSDLAKAANLARCQADIERLSDEIMEEGDIITNDRGTPIVNPKHNLLETLSRRDVALSRVLHVHTEATVGRSRDSGNKSAAQRQKRTAVASAMGDGLIPGLEH